MVMTLNAKISINGRTVLQSSALNHLFDLCNQGYSLCFSYTMSEASDSCTTYMDRLLTSYVSPLEKQRLHEKILKLVDIYYRALDAPKKGSKVCSVFVSWDISFVQRDVLVFSCLCSVFK